MSTPAARTPLDWDAETYDLVSEPQQEWAREVIDRLHCSGDEAILDAGCGSGRVTRLLAPLVPRGRIVAVDASEQMVAKARENIGDIAQVLHQDLLELTLDGPVDLVFSTAVFHHIHDHERLFARCYAALRPGGRLVAQCGGLGNIAGFRAIADAVAARDPYAQHLRGMRAPWNYAAPDKTARRLRGAGFVDTDCWLQPKPTELREPRAYLATVLLNYHLERLPAELHEPFVADVHAAAGDPVIADYVRLNMTARRI